MATSFSEKRDNLWWVAASPAVWAVHFLLSYVSVAIWCAKLAGPDASLGGARVAIAAYTALALAATGGVAWRGLAQYRRSDTDAHSDSNESRHRFLGFTLLALSGLSALAIVYEALAAVFIGSCH